MPLKEVVVGRTITSELRVEWDIDNRPSLLTKENALYRSDEFHFAGSTWYLKMGKICVQSRPDDVIALCLGRADSGCSKTVAFQFFWKTANGRVEATTEATLEFEVELIFAKPLIPISTLLEKISEYFPSDVLSIICILRYNGSNVLDVTVPEKHENQSTSTGTEASTQTEADVCIEKLQQQFQELLLDGKHSDVVLSVKGKEFAVHRDILAARSTVFSAMMEHDMKEKTSGVVAIEDSDPETFPDFLQYLYTGRVDCMTFQKALHLYVIADKYQVDQLKSVCLENMVNNITVENFCDVLSLSLRYQERELTAAASEFFVQNTMAIALTTKWQVFLGENPVAGNELLLKLVRDKLQ